jgi:lipoyl(octanoyl) transferase
MRSFTVARDDSTPDELWLCEHPPVYTQGVAGDDRHVLEPGDIPVARSDRGGQVTYHGPGQVVAYPLVDLGRLRLHVREYVFRLEQAALDVLERLGVTGHRVRGAPGIYVRLADPAGHAPLAPTAPSDDGATRFAGLGKIAALGVKVSRHRAYHGLALNVCMDLRPFSGIRPCGLEGLAAVDLSTIGVRVEPAAVQSLLGERLVARLAP